MFATNPVNVVSKLERIYVEVSRRARAATYAEIIVYCTLDQILPGRGHVDSQVGRINYVWRGSAVVSATSPCRMERIHQIGAEGVSVADRKTLNSLQIPRLRGSEKVFAVENRWIAVVRSCK